MNKNLRHIASAIAVAGFLFIGFGSDDEKTTETSIAAETPAIEVSAGQLYADYEANGVAADEKYKGKVLRVTGKVNTIDRDIMDKIYVTLKGDKYFGDIQQGSVWGDVEDGDVTGQRRGKVDPATMVRCGGSGDEERLAAEHAPLETLHQSPLDLGIEVHVGSHRHHCA